MVTLIAPTQLSSLPLRSSNKVSETDNGGLMQEEDERLRTFTDWRVPFISKKHLAKDGFYYTGRDDVVRCAYCAVEIGCWEQGDVPNTEHKRWSPSCPFLKGRVPSQSQSGSSAANAVAHPGTDMCGYLDQRPSSIEPRASLLSNLGVEPQIGVSFPKYSMFGKRLESFKDWPVSLRQKPADLANAGFYYTGVGDQTICFSCGIGLKDWQEHDDVWEEHAVWSPKCKYLRLKKDLEFIANHSEKNPAVLSASNVEYNKACSSLNINITKSDPETSGRDDDDDEEEGKEGAEDDKKKSPAVASADKPKEEEVLMCGICYNNERSILYLPCRHMIACVDCGSNAKKCPVCRKEVKAFVKAFLS